MVFPLRLSQASHFQDKIPKKSLALGKYQPPKIKKKTTGDMKSLKPANQAAMVARHPWSPHHNPLAGSFGRVWRLGNRRSREGWNHHGNSFSNPQHRRVKRQHDLSFPYLWNAPICGFAHLETPRSSVFGRRSENVFHLFLELIHPTVHQWF